MRERLAFRLFLVAAAAAIAAGGYYLVNSLQHAEGPHIDTHSDVHVDMESRRNRAGVVLQRNLFGLRTGSTQSAASESDEKTDSVSTAVEWTLHGVFVGNPGAVVLQRGDGESELVFIGQSVQGWLLKDVTPRGASWRKQGAERFTELQQDTSTGQGSAHAAPMSTVAGRIEPRQESRNMDRSIAREFAENPTAMMEQASFKPAIIGGKHVGFFINAIKPESQLDTLGVRDKDILVRIGGTYVRNLNDVQDALRKATTRGSVQLDIIREKSPLSVTYSLR